MQKVQRIQAGQALTPYAIYSNIAVFAAGVLLSKAVLLDTVAPLAAAFCMACCLSGWGIAAASLGSVAGYFIFGVSPFAVCAGVALGVGYIVCLALRIQMKELICIALFVIAAAANVLMNWSTSLFGTLTGVLEGVIALALAYAFKNGISGVNGLIKKKELKDGEMIALIGAFCLMLTGLAGVKIFKLDVLRTIAILATMTIAAASTMEWATCAGLVMGFTMAVAGSYNPLCIGSLGICALAAGGCRRMGRVGAPLGFVLSNSLFTLYVNGSTEVLLPLEEIMLAALFLMVMPRPVLEIINKFICQGYVSQQNTDTRYNLYRDMLSERLDGLTNALTTAYESLGSARQLPTRQELNVKAAQRMAIGCRDCANRNYCWQENADRNIAIAGKMLRDYLADGRIVLYREMAEDCMDTDKLTENAKEAFEAIAYEQHESGRLRIFRDATAMHLREISHITGELASGSSRPDYTVRLEKDIIERLKREGLNVLATAARTDALGRLRVRIEMNGCDGAFPCGETLSKSVSKLTGKTMRVISKPCEGKEGRCSVTLFETSRLEIKAGAAAMKREGSQMSGDHYSICKLDDGRYFACLCDGMGSGKEAATSGRIGTKMIETFFRAGYDKDRILQSVNSVMAMSGNEVFTTADVCIIDLIEKSCEFIKAGAAPSFLIRGNKAEAISGEALPIGVVENAQPSHTMRQVRDGDTILLLSDGVTDATESDIHSLLETCGGDDPKTISEEIIRLAIKKAGGKRDDMTAIVIKID